MNLMTYKQAAEYLGRAEATLRIDVMKKSIPHLKIGKQVKFDQDSLDSWLKSKAVPAMKAGR